MTTATPRNLAEVLAGAQLPALPQSAIRLMELSQDPENGPAEFASPIEADPGLTGQVLRFVNSSYFGFSREISSVKLAITLVGVRTIKNFALWSAVFSLMPNPKCGPFDLKSLWQDSLRRALFARSFGRVLGMKDAEDLFAAALLQDMAVPILAKELAGDYARLLIQRTQGTLRLSQLEQQKFGWTHATAAGMLARSWNLPESFALLMESHCDLDAHLAETPMNSGKVAVALSALLPNAGESNWRERDAFVNVYEKLRGADGATIEETFAHVDKAFGEFAPVLKLAAPSRSLLQYMQPTPAKA